MKFVGKNLKICLFLITLLNFNILGVEAKNVNNINELTECLTSGDTCTLVNNIDNNEESVEITITNKTSLDLNGYTITNYNFKISKGDFTLNDSKGNGAITTTAKYGIYATESNVVINAGKIKSNMFAIFFDKSQATINSGEFIGEQYGGEIDRASNVVINDGTFKGLNKGDYGGGYGLSSNRSTLIVKAGNFYGKGYGFHSSGCGHLEIQGGNFEGESDGMWLSNGYTCSDSENYSIITGGNFKGNTGARIQGRNTNIIAGGTFSGTQMGLNIQCANPIHEKCKESILLKGGTYISQNKKENSFFEVAAIFMNSDPNSPLKISDLLDKEYRLSNETLLGKETKDYGYYSYTESLNVEIVKNKINESNDNIEIGPNPEDSNEENTPNLNDNSSSTEIDEDPTIPENPQTGDFISKMILGGAIILVIGIIYFVRKKKSIYNI